MDYFNFQAEYGGLLSYTDKNNKILLYIKDLLNNYSKMKEQTLNSVKKSFPINKIRSRQIQLIIKP